MQRQGVASEGLRRAVAEIANNRIAIVGKLHTDLVVTACSQVDFHP
jgi:hypothetical protein